MTAAVEKFRKDYKPLPVAVDTMDLEFDLRDGCTTVRNTMLWRKTGAIPETGLFLNGRGDVTLTAITVNGAKLVADGSAYTVTADGLTLLPAAIPADAATWTVETVVTIVPEKNTLLEGLYQSGGNYCTQCEAEGFRGITYFFDRPDVMSKYTVRVEAEKERFPVLLSNGNLTGSGDAADGRHFAHWTDPFPKPCYLFALVAGALQHKEDSFVTKSGRNVVLRIYVAPNHINRVDFAMQSVKRAMKWDEDTFGLEYDLDLFNIVAVDDFNMGAMENKSLNIFNSRLIVGTPEIAADLDFSRIEGVVGHEYFHNWTGDRVTCRDWFQLTLKEGLTVYRDQEFSSDLNSRPVKRIDSVASLRRTQFDEDRGPIAHPVRPDSYIKMDNFYTSTVYNKGAEVIRMYEVVLGKAGFRKGMDLYFQRHDGQAVTCDDFLAAMADANGADLSALAKWYGQSGTPEVTAVVSFDPAARGGTLTLSLSQRTPPTKTQADKVPVLIPIRTALIGADGAPIELCIPGLGSLGNETVLLMTEAHHSFVFEKVGSQCPVASLLRNFSAPVILHVEGQSDSDLLHLLRFDNDPFNRYEAGQIIGRKILLGLYHGPTDFAERGVPESLITAFKAILEDSTIDGAFKALALSLPSHSELVGSIKECDPLRLHHAIDYVAVTVAQRLRAEFEAVVNAVPEGGAAYEFNSVAVAARAIVNKAYSYLSRLRDPAIEARLLARYEVATNLTDGRAMLDCLNYDCPSRAKALAHFHAKWNKEPLLMIKWLSIQATSDMPGNVANLRNLMQSADFNITNPNNCYALLCGFGQSAVNLHAADGSGYTFLADAVLACDKINHQVAARVMDPLLHLDAYNATYQSLIRAQVQRILDTPGISDNIRELASKTLK